jgi:hypothetical protein
MAAVRFIQVWGEKNGGWSVPASEEALVIVKIFSSLL